MAKTVNYKIDIQTKGAQKSVEDLNKDLGTTNKEVDNVNKSSKGFGKSLNKLGISMKTLGIGAVVGGITAIGGLFTTAMKTGAAFAKELSGLKAVLGANEGEMDSLSNSAKKLGATTQFTAKEVVGLQTELAKLGFTTKEILDATGATLDLAASLGVGLSEAASITGSTLRAFGLETSETQRLVDVMALSTSKSALDYDALRESLKLVAPTARAMNVDIEETTSLLAVLADNGLKGSVAGTGLSKTFIELNKQGIPLNEALETVKNSSNQLNTAIDLVGIVGSKALLTLANNAPKIDQLNVAFDGAAGSAKKLAETRLDNLAGDTTKLGSAWEGFLLSIEDGTGIFNSIARSIVQAGTAMLGLLTPSNKMSESLEKQRIEVQILNSRIQDINTSEEDRIELIRELQKEYPKLLGNINAETISNEDLQKALKKVNEELVNKIIIQRQQEKLDEQAEETATALERKMNAEMKLREKLIKVNDKFKLSVDFSNKSLEEMVVATQEALEPQSKLLGFTKLGNEKYNEQGAAIDNLQSKLNSFNNAETDLAVELGKGNILLSEKEKLLQALGISYTESSNSLESATETEIEKTRSLIAIQEELLEEKKKLPESTEKEIADKNIIIRAINEEIKRLKSLGLEQIKQTTENLDRVQIRAAQEIDTIHKVRDVHGISLDEMNRANMLYYEALDEERKKDAERERIVQNAKLNMTSDALGAIGSLANTFAKDTEESQKKAFKINKAVGIAQALIQTYQSAQGAYLSQLSIPTPDAPIRAQIAAGVATAVGLANVAAISAQKFEYSGTTAPSPSGGLGGGIGGTEPQPPAFNVVGQSGFNQIAGALGQQPPIQTFVVSQDVTTAQQLNNAIIQTATF